MTNDELRADLLADPTTAELAGEQGLTVDEYVAATLEYLDDPDAGFCGGRDAPDGEDEDGARGELSAFGAPAAPQLPGVRPGEGIGSSAAPLPRKLGLVRG